MSTAGSDGTQADSARPLAFAHMLMQVRDIDAAKRFYVEVLGFSVRQAKPLADGRPFVPFNEGIALTTGGPGSSPQIDHVAFKVHNVRGLAARCRNARATFKQDLHDGIYGLTIYVTDPDGTTIELFEEGAKL